MTIKSPAQQEVVATEPPRTVQSSSPVDELQPSQGESKCTELLRLPHLNTNLQLPASKETGGTQQLPLSAIISAATIFCKQANPSLLSWPSLCFLKQSLTLG